MRQSLLFVFLSPLVAQNQIVSPADYEIAEGNSSTGIPFSYASSRVQQVDGNLIGTVMPLLQRIEFRRDGVVTGGVSPRTQDVTILIGTGDVNAFTATFATNWTSTPTTVYTRKPTSLPDLSTPPSLLPAPWAVSLPFDTPYTYLGQQALLWEIVGENASVLTPSYSMDWASAAATVNGPTTVALGTGCTTPNGTFSMSAAVVSNAAGMNFNLGATAGPSLSPVLLLVGVSDPNLGLPGLCANLRSDALLTLPFGATDALGALATASLTVANQLSLRGQTFNMQLAAPDASQAGLPIALSQGRACTTPNRLGAAAPANVRRTFNLTSHTAATGSAPSVSAAVTRYVY